jgi:micrococcal nuclease
MFARLLLQSPRRILARAAIVLFGAAPMFDGSACAQRSLRSASQDGANCQLVAGGESTVLAVAGPQTLHLADGRFVRLSEILVPTVQSAAQGFDPSSTAMNYLRAAALGRKVEIKFGGVQRDRYGVYIAHIYVAGEDPAWLQEGLISAGYAQVFPQVDNHACSQRLAALEAKAREDKRGHWGLALFKVWRAPDARSILNLVQTYQIVEGKVDHAVESSGRVTLYFSKDRRFGFTAIIEAGVKKRLADKRAAQDWEGVTIRVRGWIDRKRGPSISIAEPEQIEFLSKEPSAPAPNPAAR